jgi:hypothetical protein
VTNVIAKGPAREPRESERNKHHRIYVVLEWLYLLRSAKLCALWTAQA